MSNSTILFITGNRLGDAVLTTGVLEHVLGLRPEAKVTVACGPLPAPLFADLGGLERIIPIVRRQGRSLAHWIELWKQVGQRRWTDVIDLRSAFFWRLLRADHRWHCRAEKRHEHRVAELARQLELDRIPAPAIHVSPDRQSRLDRLITGDRPILAVGPTANWGGKQWPADRFAEVVRHLAAPGGILAGARIAVFGAEHERQAAAAVLAATPDPLDCIGMADLLDLFALLRRCSFYIGNDSGLMHMAAAAGIPTLGLFGPSAEWRYHPWGPNGAVVRTPESLQQLTSAPDYDYRSHRSLMLGLTVPAVIEAAEQLWARTANPTAESHATP